MRRSLRPESGRNVVPPKYRGCGAETKSGECRILKEKLCETKGKCSFFYPCKTSAAAERK